METPSTPQDAAAGPERSPRAAPSPPCDPGYHRTGPYCTRCGYWNIDGIWQLKEPTRSPDAAVAVAELIDAIRLTQEYTQLPAIPGWSWYDALLKHAPDEAARLHAEWEKATRSPERFCCYVPPVGTGCTTPPELVIVGVRPDDTTDACPQHVIALTGDDAVAIYPISAEEPLAAGGFVSGPQPVLVGEKDGPFLSLSDHVELARGKTPQAEVAATADTPTDPADVHSDDVMLSAVASEGVTPLTPVEEEIRAVLNRYSAEAPSGTPDYILANYLINCLKAFNEAVSLRAVWRGESVDQ